MAQRIADRLRWAVEVLTVQPDDQILEIGCGHGVAVTLICEQLTTGKITALDRSPKMIRMASQRNPACVDGGKVAFLQTALADAQWNSAPFDKVFAVHVNLFWMNPAKELAVIRDSLKPDGRLYLFYQPLDASKLASLVDTLTRNLQENGFSAIETLSSDLPSGIAVCVMARIGVPTG